MRNWFITGVSRGFGRAMAEVALARGDRVVGTVRRGFERSSLQHRCLTLLEMDLTDPLEVAAAVEKSFELLANVDVLVNNAGHVLLGAVGEASEQQVAELFDTNVLGPMRVLRAALPGLKAQGRGCVINMTSVAGLDPLPGYGIYAGTKAALHAMTLTLAEELKPLGLRVVAVAPGSFRTDFLSSHSKRETVPDPAFASTAGAGVARFTGNDGRQPGDPRKAAEAIMALVDMEEPPAQVLLGKDAQRRASRALVGALHSFQQHEDISEGTDFA